MVVSFCSRIPSTVLLYCTEYSNNSFLIQKNFINSFLLQKCALIFLIQYASTVIQVYNNRSTPTSFSYIYIFLPQEEVPPSTLRFLQYYTMILQRPRIIVRYAGFEPGISAPEVWRATKEPLHLPVFQIPTT